MTVRPFSYCGRPISAASWRLHHSPSSRSRRHGSRVVIDTEEGSISVNARPALAKTDQHAQLGYREISHAADVALEVRQMRRLNAVMVESKSTPSLLKSLYLCLQSPAEGVFPFQERKVQLRSLLRHHNLSIDNPFMMTAADSTRIYNCSLLAAAVQIGSADAVRLLLELGADPNLQITLPCENLVTPLHSAAADGYVEVASVLLEHGARASLSIVDKSGFTPLMCAVDEGHAKMVQLLCDTGSSLEYKMEEGYDAIMVAQQNIAYALSEETGMASKWQEVLAVLEQFKQDRDARVAADFAVWIAEEETGSAMTSAPAMGGDGGAIKERATVAASSAGGSMAVAGMSEPPVPAAALSVAAPPVPVAADDEDSSHDAAGLSSHPPAPTS